MLVEDAKRLMVWVPHVLLKCRDLRGAGFQSELSVTRERMSAQTFAALRMYRVQILMSYVSVRRNSFRSSHIIAGDFEVRWVSTPITDWLSS